MKNTKTFDYRPLLLSNRLPEKYLNNPKSDTLRFGMCVGYLCALDAGISVSLKDFGGN